MSFGIRMEKKKKKRGGGMGGGGGSDLGKGRTSQGMNGKTGVPGENIW